MGLEVFEKFEVREKEDLDMLENEMEIDLTKVEDVEEREYVFDEGTERERRVKRYLYKIKGRDKRLLIPKSVHDQIVLLVKKKNVASVQVFIEGSGVRRRYTVIPTSFNK